MAEPGPLPPGITLRVWSLRAPKGAEPIFESKGKWLHPLFELTEFLSLRPEIDPADLILRDRVIGRAAAFLILRMGVTHAGADVVSQRALSLFTQRGWSPTADTIVERIGCQTEDLLAKVDNIDDAWDLLIERRRIALMSLQRPVSS